MARSYKRDKMGRFSSVGGSSGGKGFKGLDSGSVPSSDRALGGTGNRTTPEAAARIKDKYNPNSPNYFLKNVPSKPKRKFGSY